MADRARAETLLRQVALRPAGTTTVDLARAVCLAVIVEPGLLRRARRRLVPGADAGIESDLWFSPLVTTRNVTGIVLDPDVLAVLREQLAGEPDLAHRARDLVAQLHAGHPPALRLEEDVVWESVRLADRADPAIETLLRPAVKAMAVDADGGRAVARWAAQALRRLPEAAARTDAAHLLGIGTALRLGTAAGVAGFGPAGMPASVGWLAPSGSGAIVRMGVELTTDGLRFAEPAAAPLVIELPVTSPLVAEVGWHDGETERTEVVVVAPGVSVAVGPDAGEIALRTLDGRRYVVEPVTAQPSSPVQIVDDLLGVARATFVNRVAELRQIESFLESPGLRLLNVVGPAGIGKTALVRRFFDQQVSPVPLADRVLFYNAGGPRRATFDNVINDLIGMAPGESRKALRPRVSAVLKTLPARQIVVVFDDFDSLIDAETGAVRETALDDAISRIVAEPGHDVRLILISRHPWAGPNDGPPKRRRRLVLDAGLPVAEAVQFLLRLDPTGALGLSSAPAGLRERAARLTDGSPRALELLASVLAADPAAGLSDLLDQLGEVPSDRIAEHLRRLGFDRLDLTTTRILQALAIYREPVPPAAIDDLLGPDVPGINSAPVLRRLVETHFVQPAGERYQVSPTDVEFLLSGIPSGTGTLLDRAAEYFRRISPPYDAPVRFPDFAPAFTEFDLRCRGEDWEGAARVLLRIGDLLLDHARYDVIIALYDQVIGHVDDPSLANHCSGLVGAAYGGLGRYDEAVDKLYRASAQSEAQGDELASATWLTDLGRCSAAIGRTGQAIDVLERAVSIARANGDPRREAVALTCLGESYRTQGRIREAIDLQQRALAMLRVDGDVRGQAECLAGLAACWLDSDSISGAREAFEEAREVAALWGIVPVQSVAASGSAVAHLFLDDLEGAYSAAQAAIPADSPVNNPNAWLTWGVVLTTMGEPGSDQDAFLRAVKLADRLLSHSRQNYAAQGVKAIALSALVLLGAADQLAPAVAAARAAREITNESGAVLPLFRLLDLLEYTHRPDSLQQVREALKPTPG